MRRAAVVVLVALVALAVGFHMGRSSAPPPSGWSRLTDGRFVESAGDGAIVLWTIKDGKATEARRLGLPRDPAGNHLHEAIFTPEPIERPEGR